MRASDNITYLNNPLSIIGPVHEHNHTLVVWVVGTWRSLRKFDKKKHTHTHSALKTLYRNVVKKIVFGWRFRKLFVPRPRWGLQINVNQWIFYLRNVKINEKSISIQNILIPHRYMNTITHGCVISKVHLIKINRQHRDMHWIFNLRSGDITCDCVFWEIRKHKMYRPYLHIYKVIISQYFHL